MKEIERALERAWIFDRCASTWLHVCPFIRSAQLDEPRGGQLDVSCFVRGQTFISRQIIREPRSIVYIEDDSRSLFEFLGSLRSEKALSESSCRSKKRLSSF